MRLFLALLGAAVLGVFAARAAASPGAASFALTPQHYDPSLRVTRSYFVTVAEPGTTFRNSVRVRNTGTRRGTALLYAVDATTGQTSGAVYLGRAIPRRGVGAWIRLGATSVTLAPGTSRLVPITVHVPATARPGDHLGGIVAENASLTGSTGRGALRIRVRHLTITAVEVQIPGEAATRFDVTGARAGGEHGYQYVYLHMRNLGALTTKPSGRVTVTGADGKTVAAHSVELDTFLPGTSIDYPVLLPDKALEPGAYHADVELTYSAAAIGYRRAAGRERTVSRSVDFAVSATQYTSVFKGAPPVRAPSATTSHGGGQSMLLIIVSGLAALLVAGFAVLGVRRWTRSA